LGVPAPHTGYTDIPILTAAVIQDLSPKMNSASIPTIIYMHKY